MKQWGDLFTARQKVSIVSLLDCVLKLRTEEKTIGKIAGLALSRFTDICNALCQWKNTSTQVVHLFTRQAIPIVWDFAEANVLGAQSGDFSVTLGSMRRVAEAVPKGQSAHVQIADASSIQSTSANGSESEAPVNESDSDDVDDEDDTAGKAKKGLTLIFDVVRRFSQPLGIHLDN